MAKSPAPELRRQLEWSAGRTLCDREVITLLDEHYAGFGSVGIYLSLYIGLTGHWPSGARYAPPGETLRSKKKAPGTLPGH